MLETEFQSGVSKSGVYFNGSAWSPARSSNTGAGRQQSAERRVALTDSAVHVVTDFSWEPPVTIAEDRPIDEALREMMLAGVRALLVVQGKIVTGLITSYDIQGERPLQFLQTSNYTRHDEIEVGHIMTPWDLVPMLDWLVFGRTARVADIVKLFKRTHATHLVLVEYAEQGGTFVRGLISRTQLERQLGHSIEIDR